MSWRLTTCEFCDHGSLASTWFAPGRFTLSGLEGVKDHLTTQGLLSLLDRSRDPMAGGGRARRTTGAGAFATPVRERPSRATGSDAAACGCMERSFADGSDAYHGLVLAVLRGYGATGDAAIHATRFMRASLLGFIDLELGAGFGLPKDVDASFSALLQMLDAGLRSLLNGSAILNSRSHTKGHR